MLQHHAKGTSATTPAVGRSTAIAHRMCPVLAGTLSSTRASCTFHRCVAAAAAVEAAQAGWRRPIVDATRALEWDKYDNVITAVSLSQPFQHFFAVLM
jgi:hypothetical protein